MNVLFLGQYRGPENDGWSIAARRYLEALLLTGHNISCKPVYMGGNRGAVSKAVEQAEQNTFETIDIVIQNVLPDLMERHDCYNIGIFYNETNNIQNTGWIEKVNLMDEIWVSSVQEQSVLKENGVTIKITVIPVPYKPPTLQPKRLDVPELEHKFVFYFVGEYNERKNISALAKAFQREFTKDEDVALLIKTNTEAIKQELNEWKKSSRTRKDYMSEAIISTPVNEQSIMDIHETCDCFVCPSRGEGFCLPIMDALYFNNPVLCTDNIYPTSIFQGHITPVKSMEVPVDCLNPPLPHIYTGNETWYEISILDLQKCMRHEYENRNKRESRQFIIDDFSQQKIANKIKECFNVYNQ